MVPYFVKWTNWQQRRVLFAWNLNINPLDLELQGRSVYKDYKENYLSYEGTSKSWIVSPHFDVTQYIMKTASCPQQG